MALCPSDFTAQQTKLIMEECFYLFGFFLRDLAEENKLKEEIESSSLEVQSCSNASAVRLDVVFNRLNINAGRALVLTEGAGKPEGREREPSLEKCRDSKEIPDSAKGAARKRRESCWCGCVLAESSPCCQPRDRLLLAPYLREPL